MNCGAPHSVEATLDVPWQGFIAIDGDDEPSPGMFAALPLTAPVSGVAARTKLQTLKFSFQSGASCLSQAVAESLARLPERKLSYNN